MTSVFTDDSAERKNYPVYSGVLRYFPLAVEAVANCDEATDEDMGYLLLKRKWVELALHAIANLEWHTQGGYSGPVVLVGGSVTALMLQYPHAFAQLANLSKKGNDKHNAGEPLHWAREKSSDHEDCVARHLIDNDHVELAWRALANLQLAEERRLEKTIKTQLYGVDPEPEPVTALSTAWKAKPPEVVSMGVAVAPTSEHYPKRVRYISWESSTFIKDDDYTAEGENIDGTSFLITGHGFVSKARFRDAPMEVGVF